MLLPSRIATVPLLVAKALLTLAVLGLCPFATAEETSRPPNIVLILSDDQAWTDYGFMNHPVIKTPRLDQLAKQSVVFRRGYVPTSLCRPSLMTIVTGQYASVHGVTGNDPSPKYATKGSPLYNQRRDQLISKIDAFDTLPKLLGKAGYVSHQSGKWWEGNYSRGGFDQGMTRGFPQRGGRHGDDGLDIGRKGLQPVTDFIDKAVAGDKPFFVWYAPFLPHTPHTPPEEYLAKYRTPDRPITIAKYYAMCEWFDATCGQVIDHLEEKGVRDNTLIVYLTDNGWIQNPEARGYAPRSKQTPFEGGVRTPIMYSWPAALRPADRPELASSIDIYPTILSAAGVEVTSKLPGLDLLPAMRTAKPIERDQIFGEGFAHDVADVDRPEASLLYRWTIRDRWKLILTYDGEINRYKSTHPRDDAGPKLYDLDADPAEQTNLASEHPSVVNELFKSIADWYPLKERVVMQ